MKYWQHNPGVGEEAAGEGEVTIVIQGRLAARGLERIGNYQRFGRVIVSCWETCDKEMLAGVDLERVPVVLSEMPGEGEYFNYGNVLLQTLTTLHGLEHVRTPWAIKVRCDEYYSDLGAFIERMKESPRKIITNNVFFRKDAIHKFHISDHVIGGRAENMRATFRILKERCLRNEPGQPRTPGWMPTEALIATSYLRHLGVEARRDRSKDLMREYFDLVRVSEMGEFYCAYNGLKTCFTKEEEILASDSIASMKEL
jgi:hypothetical protein